MEYDDNRFVPVKMPRFAKMGTPDGPAGAQYGRDMAGNPIYTFQAAAPEATVAEQQLVGMCIDRPDIYPRVSWLKPEDFLHPEHAICWDAIASLTAKGETVTPLKIKQLCGWSDEDSRYFMACASSIVSYMSHLDYAKAVLDAAHKRRIVEIAKRLANDASSTELDITGAEIAAAGVSSLTDAVKGVQENRTLAQATKAVIEKWLQPNQGVRSTGYPRLDHALAGGFHASRFYMIGARYKAGKSMMLASIAYQMTVLQSDEEKKRHKKVLYLALEMGDEEIANRMLGRKLGINSLELLDPAKRTAPQMLARAQKAAADLEGCGLEFRNHPRMSLDDLKATLARVGMSGRYDGVILDYLQLVTGRRRNESIADHSDNVAQTCAEMTKRYGFWMLGAYQLNRDGQARGGDGPMNACDVSFELCRDDGSPDAWLEMTATRYTRSTNIGSQAAPAYELVGWEGPYFSERKAP